MFVLVVVLVVGVIALYCGLRIERWRRTPADLRGDWWAAFEAEFRAYATRWERSRRRHNDHGSIGQ